MRVVRAPYQRPRLDVHEAHVERDVFERAELVGMVVPRHRQMLLRRPKVLAEREDRAAGASQIAQGGNDFVPLFAETEHDARLRRDAWRVLARAVEQLERALVA